MRNIEIKRSKKFKYYLCHFGLLFQYCKKTIIFLKIQTLYSIAIPKFKKFKKNNPKKTPTKKPIPTYKCYVHTNIQRWISLPVMLMVQNWRKQQQPKQIFILVTNSDSLKISSLWMFSLPYPPNLAKHCQSELHWVETHSSEMNHCHFSSFLTF